VKARRDAWRTMQAIHNKEEVKKGNNMSLIIDYKQKIEGELADKCNDVLGLINDYLIPNSDKSKNAEAIVFFMKMKGDYFRYLGEFQSDRKDVIEKANEAYKRASEEAEKLKTTHPIRLGLALNYSVFYYEILNQPDIACNLAKKAFDHAI
jgi:14-3-3 protein epsilon